jgi:hypothetical protein
LPPSAELPAQDLAKRPRRHAVGIEKALAVEMIGEGAGISHAGQPDRGHTDCHAQSGKESEGAAAGDFHGGIGADKGCFPQGSVVNERVWRRISASFLDF